MESGSKVTFVLRYNEPRNNLNYHKAAPFILGSHLSLGGNKLRNSREFQRSQLADAQVFTYSALIPESTEITFSVFTAVYRRRKHKVEYSLLTREYNTRQVVIDAGPEQTIDLGVYGEHEESGGLLRNLALRDDIAIHWLFSSSREPVLQCQGKPYDGQFSIKVTSVEGATAADVCTGSLTAEGFLEDDTSYVCIQARSFHTQTSELKLVCEFVDSSDNELGTLALDFATIKSQAKSHGTLKLPLQKSSQENPLTVFLEFIYATPLPNNSYCLPDPATHAIWRNSEMLMGGHRGSGNSFTGHHLSDVRENTLEAFQAAEAGGTADFVEFDVALTWDRIPIVYHDLGLILDGVPTTTDRLTYQEIQTATSANPTQVKHNSEAPELASTAKKLIFNASKPWTMPKLIDLYTSDKISADLSFNIEIKWPVKYDDHTSECDLEENWVDLGRYCDAIVAVVEAGAMIRGHNVIYSCFEANVCAMLKYKQSRFPVLQLIHGDTKLFIDIRDVRVRRSQHALDWSHHMGYLGVNTLIEKKSFDEVCQYAEQCHAKGIKLFCYGDDMQDREFLDKMKQDSMLDGLMFDLIHQETEWKQTYQ